MEEEVRTLAGYKFDECNSNGTILVQYRSLCAKCIFTKQNECNFKAYNQLSASQLEYVSFYMGNHKQIPTWIMFKVVNFSTFIDLIKYSKTDVSHSLCNLYGLYDDNGHYNVKLLIGSLHWMRKIRNACAHNERVYCLTRKPDKRGRSGRIIEKYLRTLRSDIHATWNKNCLIYLSILNTIYQIVNTSNL